MTIEAQIAATALMDVVRSDMRVVAEIEAKLSQPQSAEDIPFFAAMSDTADRASADKLTIKARALVSQSRILAGMRSLSSDETDKLLDQIKRDQQPAEYTGDDYWA